MSLMPSVESANAVTGNWIPDINRYNLPKPPDWFLKTVWDQDAGLVIIPSRQSRKYILARRRERSRTIATIAHQMTIDEKVHRRVNYSDSDMLAGLKLVAVDAITGNVYHGSWMRSCPAMLTELRSRDMWALGGADKFIEQLEGREKRAEEKKRANLLDDIDHRARDAWRSYQARTGQRNQRANSGRAKIVPVGTL